MKYNAIGFLEIKTDVNDKQNMDRDVKSGENMLR